MGEDLWGDGEEIEKFNQLNKLQGGGARTSLFLCKVLCIENDAAS